MEYFDEFFPLKNEKIKGKRINIATIGRIEKNKNPSQAVDISIELARHGFNVRLMLMGRVTNQEYYQSLIKRGRDNNVKIKNIETSRTGVLKLLPYQDFVLHTSHIESLPLVLFESNIAGVPFFSIPAGGIPEILPVDYHLNDDPKVAAHQIIKKLNLN